MRTGGAFLVAAPRAGRLADQRYSRIESRPTMDLEIDACGRGEGKSKCRGLGGGPNRGTKAIDSTISIASVSVVWQVKDCLANGSLATDVGVRNTLEASRASRTAKR